MNLNSRTLAVIVGAAIGAVVGGGAGWTYIRQQEAKNQLLTVKQPEVIQANAGDFIKIGVAVLGLVKMFDELFKPKK